MLHPASLTPVMSERNGKQFIGAYIKAETKGKLQRLASAQDRPLAYIVEKILAEGVTHHKAQLKPSAR